MQRRGRNGCFFKRFNRKTRRWCHWWLGNLKAVIPGGSSMPLLPKHICDTIKMDFDECVDNKTGLGTAGIVVINNDQDIIKCIARIARFYKHESCGQCTPCREGTGWLYRILDRITNGQGKESDLALLVDVAGRIEGNTICAFGDASAWPVQSFIKHYHHEFEYMIQNKGKTLAA